LHSQPDFFGRRYNSKYLAGFVAVLGVICIIPYLQLQLTGIGIIVEVASFGGIGRVPAMVIAVALVTTFVFLGGIRAVAWVSILKDVLMIVAALSIGIGVPYIYFGGIGRMFTELARTHAAHLVMPGATPDLGHAWYISTVFLSALGVGMWPHNFAAAFTAKNVDTLRRNAIVLPLYNLSLAFMMFAGLAAILVIPGLSDSDLVLLTIVRKTFPVWFLGVIGGAGALTAMVPAAVQILTAATLFAKNLYRPVLAPAIDDEHVARLARFMVPVLGLVTLYFAIFSSRTLVGLLLVGYSLVTQFFPGVALGLYWKRVTKSGVFAGLFIGVTSAAFLIFTNRDPFLRISAGFWALCANFVVTIAGSLLTSSEASGFDERPALTPISELESP
jgi:solute:Na+ symporter, SSS family